MFFLVAYFIMFCLTWIFWPELTLSSIKTYNLYLSILVIVHSTDPSTNLFICFQVKRVADELWNLDMRTSADISVPQTCLSLLLWTSFGLILFIVTRIPRTTFTADLTCSFCCVLVSNWMFNDNFFYLNIFEWSLNLLFTV